MRIHESKDDSRSQKQMELWIEKMQEKFNKDLGELKTNRDEQDNNQSEKCTKGIYSRTTETEEWTSNLEDRMMEISTVEQNKEKRMKRNENSIRELWDNIKCTNIWTIGVPKEEEKYKWPEQISEEIRVKNFSNKGKEMVTQVQEVQTVSYKINPRRNMLKHILIKLTQIKYKQKILKATTGRITNNIERNLPKVISWFFSRNSAAQKGVARSI